MTSLFKHKLSYAAWVPPRTVGRHIWLPKYQKTEKLVFTVVYSPRDTWQYWILNDLHIPINFQRSAFRWVLRKSRVNVGCFFGYCLIFYFNILVSIPVDLVFCIHTQRLSNGFFHIALCISQCEWIEFVQQHNTVREISTSSRWVNYSHIPMLHLSFRKRTIEFIIHNLIVKHATETPVGSLFNVHKIWSA